MHLPRYHLRSGYQNSTYFFESSGGNGVTEKIIQFTRINNNATYNLSFGDWDENKQRINDRVVSNNGDKRKILATVVSAIYNFTLENPNAWIYIKGSTSSRTRLYRMVINLYSELLLQDFVVAGEKDGYWEKFSGNKNYTSFIFKKRII